MSKERTTASQGGVVGRCRLAAGSIAAAVTLGLAAVAWGASFEICTVAANCKTAAPSTGLGGEMDTPFDAGTDAAGNVYVADRGNHRIQKFDSSGNFERTWGKDVVSAGPGNTGAGFEICVAANGDTCKAASAPGAPALGGEFNFPASVATDAAGNVYVADKDNNRIQKFDSAGNFLRAWGRNAIQDGKLGDLGIVFEICTVPADCQGGSGGGLGGEMADPAAVATDATTGDVYVADRNQDRVQEFDSMGGFQRTWGKDVDGVAMGTGFEVCTMAADCKVAAASTGLGGEMDFPDGVATGAASGDVYVSDGTNDRVQQFDASGTFQRTWGKDVIDPAAGSDTGAGFEICMMAADCKAAAASTGRGGEMDFPAGLATDAATGDLYVAELADDRVQEFDSMGNFLRAWGRDVVLSGEHDTVADGFEICVNPAGSNPDDLCKVASPSTGLGGEMSRPIGLATAPGSVYVADRDNHRIQRFDNSGNFLRTWGNDVDNTPPGPAPPSSPPNSPPGSGLASGTPSNAFTVGGLKGRTLTLNVGSAGTVEVSDASARTSGRRAIAAARKLLKSSSATGGPGTLRVKLRLTKVAKQKLRRSGKVKVAARITFTPSGGTSSSQPSKLKIKQKRSRR